MSGKHIDPCETNEERVAGQKLSNNGNVDKLANSNDPRQLAIKSLLENVPFNLDDKLATVKTAHHVDKDRFQTAFRSLMGARKP